MIPENNGEYKLRQRLMANKVIPGKCFETQNVHHKYPVWVWDHQQHPIDRH